MKKAILIPLIVVVLAIGWWLGSPLFIDKVVDEELPVAAQQQVVVEAPIEEDIPSADPATSQVVELDDDTRPADGVTPPPAQELESLAGFFVDADRFHKGSGEVTVIGDTLRFEDFSVTNGPDLKVYLATDDTASDFVDLGRLKGNKGNQNYEIPQGTDLEKYDTVLIWCKAFSVLFSTAELQ